MFDLKSKTNDDPNNGMLFIDYKGRAVRTFRINGVYVLDERLYDSQRLYIPSDLQREGPNTVEIMFESNFVTDCAGIHYFKDVDGSEYVYSELEPANAHIWFPCFDQPDLKAPYRLLVFAPEEWKVVSTCRQVGGPDKTKIVLGSPVFRLDGDILKEFTDSFKGATFYAVEFAKS